MSETLIRRYVTGGDRQLHDWHLFLQRVTFTAALVLMSASVVSLHWACNLIGLRGWWEPVAWLVPLAMEGGMAAVASTATTIRKDSGSYYLSLWLIFSFVMLLAQVSNIGHAIVSVADQELPTGVPEQAAYLFACTFAALFPLGGTMFVHVSGFLRVRGAGARWVDQDAAPVFEAAPTPVRAPRAPRAVSAPVSAPERAPQPTARRRDGEYDRARKVFDRLIAADPHTKPIAKAIHVEARVTKSEQNTRKWVASWWEAHTTLTAIGGVA